MMNGVRPLAKWRLLLRCRNFASWAVDSETGIVSCDKKPTLQTVIGLEVHAQLNVSTKLFSSADSSSIATLSSSVPPNSHVHLFDVAVPGSLPRLSQEAVQQAVRTAAALQCDIPLVSRFERKHYAYADLPHGYQVTQQRWPLAQHGKLCCRSRRRKKRPNQAASFAQVFQVDIDRIQLEQDTGKTTHYNKSRSSNGSSNNDVHQQQQQEQHEQESWVDFNRAGCALVEIVMAPQLKSPQQAGVALESLRSLLIHIGACNGRMEEGSLRCDLNISLSPTSTNDGTAVDNINTLGKSARVEVKNLNSIRHVVKAAEYEAKRQAQELYDTSNDNGKKQLSETRTFDPLTSRTILLRGKEGEDDYRFMPEPDLPPLVLDKEAFGEKTLQDFLAETLPELPETVLARYMNDYGLSQDESLVLTGHPASIHLFDQAALVTQALVGQNHPPQEIYKLLSKIIGNHLFALVKESGNIQHGPEDHDDDDDDDNIIATNFSKINGQQLGETMAMVLEEKISVTMAKQILTTLYHDEQSNNHHTTRRRSPQQVADELGFALITDPQQLRILCSQVVAEHPQELEQYKIGGKYVRRIEKFLVGKIMAQTKNNAHPERLVETLREVLEKVAPGVK